MEEGNQILYRADLKKKKNRDLIDLFILIFQPVRKAWWPLEDAALE